MKEDILSRLIELDESFSKKQKSIAKYIFDNCDSAAFMTASGLAKASGVSESTVVRFALEIGYDGFPGMRKAMQEIVRGRFTAMQLAVGSVESNHLGEVFMDAVASDADSVRAAANVHNAAGFEKAAELLIVAKHLYICGHGLQRGMAASLYTAMSMLRDGVKFCTEESIYAEAGKSEPGDLIIYMTFPPHFSREYGIVKFAHSRQINLAVMTDSEDYMLMQHADAVLSADSRAAMMTFVSALIAAAEAGYDRHVSDVLTTAEAQRTNYEGDEHGIG